MNNILFYYLFVLCLFRMLKKCQSLLAQTILSRNFTYSVIKRYINSSKKLASLAIEEPAYINERLMLFNDLYLKREERIDRYDHSKINICLSDGKVMEGLSWETTPNDIAMGISKSLASNAVIAKVNGALWDLDRVLEGNCSLEILNFDSKEGKEVFWHSSAHVLGEALELHYKGLLCYGPPINEGFYYDMFMDNNQVSSKDFNRLEALIKQIITEKQKFIQLEMLKSDLLDMFSYNPFKLRILEKKIKSPTATVYKCGPLIDLCIGPHVTHTGKLKAFSLVKNSSTYWEGNKDAESLQRVYGISFPNHKSLKEWKFIQEEAAKRDHRKIGKDQELFFFHEMSPGSCFFLPNGAFIYNKLVEFIRDEYRNFGYEEVVTPNIYSTKLWETSGHWQHYSDNMFSFDIEDEKYALKPMNCPGHCLMFDTRPRSWKELPVRLADFGVLHRNELSGTLSGLTRVRRFQQDDAHIFCSLDQVEDEIKNCLEFLRSVYEVFGFSFNLCLATRPEKYMGSVELWDFAEQQLEKSLDGFNVPWELNPGDGAFYGPKIDIQIQDAIKRHHQCATIQLDFQLPERFGLSYISKTGESKTPVIIHRAILGSVERMMAILTENYGGKWPFWLSPTQAIVIPVSSKYDSYAVSVTLQLKKEGFRTDVNKDEGETLNKKIRNAQLKQYNFILVVGEKELESQSVNVRTRDNKVHGIKSLSDLIWMFNVLTKEKVKCSEEEF